MKELTKLEVRWRHTPWLMPRLRRINAEIVGASGRL
jgi:hypothetical protein